MQFIKTEIPEVVITEPKILGDSRGYFAETFKQADFELNVVKTNFIQDNESKSGYGVLRGLHYQLPPFAQSKLVRVIQGKVLDVAVDIRKGSPTFGKHVAVELSDDNKRQLFVPRGFAHGFVVLSEQATFLYKVDNLYAPDYEGGIFFNDPILNIDWLVPAADIQLSDKDKMLDALNKARLFDYKQVLY